jgi:hypothetical protein
MAGKRSTKSLENEIGSLEKQIRARRSDLKADSIRFVKELKNRISDPNVMLAGGSVGFIVGELTKRPKMKVPANKIPMSKASMADLEGSRPKVKTSTPIKDLSQFVAVSYSLLNSWPVAALITYLQKDSARFNAKNGQKDR